jgi:hypothetical protein
MSCLDDWKHDPSLKPRVPHADHYQGVGDDDWFNDSDQEILQ